jgi:hypothetical protein
MEELINIQSELKAPKNQTNNFGKYKYRSCEDILEAVKPLCVKNSCLLTISDEMVMLGDRFYVKATAKISRIDNNISVGDQEISVSVSAYARESEVKKGMDDSQITGSASSYARKYALNGLFCIDDTKEADTMDNSYKDEQKVNVPIQLVTPIQKAKLKDYLAEFRNKAVPSAVTYIEDALGDRKLTTIEADKIINHCKMKLETV